MLDPYAPRKSSQRSTMIRKAGVAAGCAAVILAAAFGVYEMVSGDGTPKRRVMETVQLKLLPPPPPPKTEPPPPPPPKMVEQKIQQPVDKPDDKPKDKAEDKPPPGPLALDAKGGPGGDAFGLGGKPGGADYVGGPTVGGGGHGMGFAHYATVMQDEIGKRLHEDEKLDFDKFRGTLKIWLTAAGRVERVEFLRTTGNVRTDDRIREALASMAMPEAPPKEMPQPVIVRVGARPVNES